MCEFMSRSCVRTQGSPLALCHGKRTHSYSSAQEQLSFSGARERLEVNRSSDVASKASETDYRNRRRTTSMISKLRRSDSKRFVNFGIACDSQSGSEGDG